MRKGLEKKMKGEEEKMRKGEEEKMRKGEEENKKEMIIEHILKI